MSRGAILEGLTTERSRTAFVTMWDRAETEYDKLADDVKRRKKLSWSEEFAMRNAALTAKLGMQQEAVVKAFAIEFEEFKMKATVQLVATDLENGRV